MYSMDSMFWILTACSVTVYRPCENMVGVNIVLFNPCLNEMYSARTMFTPTMISRRRCRTSSSGKKASRDLSLSSECYSISISLRML